MGWPDERFSDAWFLLSGVEFGSKAGRANPHPKPRRGEVVHPPPSVAVKEVRLRCTAC